MIGHAGRTAASAGALRPLADGLGVVASAACAIHCVLAPTLLIAGTTLPSFLLEDEWFHRALLWVILPSALIAFGLGCRRHKDRWVLGLGVVGVIGIVAAGTVLHDLIGENGERIATLASAGILVAAHVRNFRRCRASGCEHDGDGDDACHLPDTR